MTIDDIVRRIVREEIERRFPRPAPEPLQTWPDLLDRPSSCPRGCPIGTLCGASDCPMRAPVVTYDGVAAHELPPVVTVQRTGCTCPPTSPVSACPDPTCPWKPR